jgi:hypothetical protein
MVYYRSRHHASNNSRGFADHFHLESRMRLSRLTGTTLLVLGLIGCASQKKEQPMAVAPPASESRVMEIRQSYQRSDRNAQVGVVIAIEAGENLAAVGDLMLDRIREDDVVTFIDSNEHPIANGTVVRKTSNAAHIRYETISGGREPVVGDLAVKF